MLEKWRTKPQKRGATRPATFEPEVCRTGSAIWLDTSCITPKYEPGSGCVPREFLYRLVLHELLHAIGIPHSEEEDTIMHPQLSAKASKILWGQDTLTEIERLYPR
jgi:hypothetical protein